MCEEPVCLVAMVRYESVLNDFRFGRLGREISLHHHRWNRLTLVLAKERSKRIHV
jgi:hypothetical protein